MSDDLEDIFEQLVTDLRTERDELRVRAHLLKAEAREEWDQLAGREGFAAADRHLKDSLD